MLRKMVPRLGTKVEVFVRGLKNEVKMTQTNQIILKLLQYL